MAGSSKRAKQLTPAEIAAKLEKIRGAVEAEVLKREFTIKGSAGASCFTFEKMPATVGDEVLDSIREQLGTGFQMPNESGGLDKAFIVVLASLPRDYVVNLQQTMFGFVRFTNEMATSPGLLAGNEVTAFDAIEAEPGAIKHILLRSMAVNFTSSLRDLYGALNWVESLTSSL